MSRTSASSSVNSSSSSSSSSSGRHRSRRQFRAVVVLVVPLLALGAGAAPATRHAARTTLIRSVAPEVVSFVRLHNETWRNPCRVPTQPNGKRNQTNHTGNKEAERQTLQNLEGILNLTLNDLNQWQSHSVQDTTWSSDVHNKNYKFLRPFVANVSTWERRLSIYWASLGVVITEHEQQSGTIDIRPGVLKVMRELNNHNRELLCSVREYRTVVNDSSNPIGPMRMLETLKFNFSDVSVLKIDRWYIMCRLQCYLQHMQSHVKRLIENTAPPGKASRHDCEDCPYNRLKAAKNRPKVPRGHGGGGSGSDRPAKQQHGASRQPNHNKPHQRKEKTTIKPQPSQPKKSKKKGRKKHVAAHETSSSSSSSSSSTNSSPRPHRQG